MGSTSRSVAIIGSGPSGCYTSQFLRKALPDAEITVFDRLPVPYGLVRYGVAPDHTGTKAVSAQFDRLFERGEARFVGNVEIGTTLTLDGLRAAFDVVVLATGLYGDVALELPGASLPGVIGAGRFTRTVNQHPDEAEALPSLGDNVVVIGHGNVAIDVARLIAKTADDFDGSELCDEVLRPAAAHVARIEVVGRSAVRNAKFDPVMVKELGRIEGVAFEIHDHAAAVSGEPEGGQLARIAAIAELAALPVPEHPRVVVSFRFGLTPAGFGGESVVESARFESAQGELVTLPASAAVTAIGFEARPGDLAVAADAPGVFTVGWLSRGPQGTIPENRVESKALAQTIAGWLAAQPVSDKPGFAGVEHLLDESVGFDSWTRVDEHERATAPAGRSRSKLAQRHALLAVARPEKVSPAKASPENTRPAKVSA